MDHTKVLCRFPKISIRKPESSVTPWFLLAAQIYTFTYRKIPPVLADITLINDSTLLVRVYPIRSNVFQFIWTFIIIFGGSLYGIGLSAVLFKKLVKPDDTELDHIEIVICIGYVSCLVLWFAWLCTVVKHRNKILLMNDFLNNGLRLGVKIKSPSREYSGYLMVAMTIGMLVFLIPLPYVIVILHFDPLYILAREFIMPPLTQWNLYHIFSLYICCLSSCPFGCYMIVKYIFILTFIFVVLTNHIKNYAMVLFSIKTPNELKFLKWFIACRLFVVSFEGPLSHVLLYIVCWTQVVLTIAAWVIINCFSILPTLVIVTALAGFIGGIVTSVCLFRNLVYARSYSGEVVRKKRSQFHTFNRSRCNYYLTAKWKARQEFPISCGNLFAMTKEAVNNYLSILNANVSNAVLLVRP